MKDRLDQATLVQPGVSIVGEQAMPERLQLLKQHQSRVEEHPKEVERHLEVISFKVASKEEGS